MKTFIWLGLIAGGYWIGPEIGLPNLWVAGIFATPFLADWT